jgi:hypothetical protein
MADRVHALVHAVQPPCGDAVAHGARGQAAGAQLVEGDPAVLHGRDPGDLRVGATLGGFRPPTCRNPPGVPHAAILREDV